MQASKTTVIECERKLAEAKNYADVKAAQENEKKGKQRSVSDPMKRLIAGWSPRCYFIWAWRTRRRATI